MSGKPTTMTPVDSNQGNKDRFLTVMNTWPPSRYLSPLPGECHKPPLVPRVWWLLWYLPTNTRNITPFPMNVTVVLITSVVVEQRARPCPHTRYRHLPLASPLLLLNTPITTVSMSCKITSSTVNWRFHGTNLNQSYLLTHLNRSREGRPSSDSWNKGIHPSDQGQPFSPTNTVQT